MTEGLYAEPADDVTAIRCELPAGHSGQHSGEYTELLFWENDEVAEWHAREGGVH